jgi:hypothetical protein
MAGVDETDQEKLDLPKFRKKYRDAIWIGGVVVLFWLVTSAWLLIDGSPAAFNRLGSVGVAASLFAFVLISQARQDYESGLQAFYSMTSRTYLATLRDLVEIRCGITVSQVMGEAKHSDHAKEQLAGLNGGFDALDQSLRAADHQFDVWEARARLAAILELVAAIFATIQWGYGDLFHCWINGNGWTTC